MDVKHKKNSDRQKSGTGCETGPSYRLKAKTYFRSKAGWKYLLILISAPAITSYYGCSNHKSPKAASLTPVYKVDMPSGKINPTQNTRPEITGIKNTNFLATHSPRLLTTPCSDLPHRATIVANRRNLPGSFKLKGAKMLIVNVDTDDGAQADIFPLGMLPVEPDDPSPSLRVTDTGATLRARAQMNAYLDSLTIAPGSTGLMTNAQRMTGPAAKRSNAGKRFSADTLRQAILSLISMH